MSHDHVVHQARRIVVFLTYIVLRHFVIDRYSIIEHCILIAFYMTTVSAEILEISELHVWNLLYHKLIL
jgi:hypothetical protein